MLCESLDLNHCTESISVFRYQGSLCSLPILRSARRRKLIYSKRSSDPEEIAPRCTAVPFNIPVAGGEPITLALKYGNRAAGSAYRRLDKRCDARSIGPPTDRSRSRAPLFSSFCSLVPLPSPRPSRARSTRNHLLCTWLEADCYLGILPFLRPAVHIARRSRAPPDSGRTWSYQTWVKDSVSEECIIWIIE